MTADAAYVALGEQHAELEDILDSLAPDQWSVPSTCAGWTVSDVVLHLAQTDELARASLDGSLGEELARLSPAPRDGPNGDVEDFAEAAVAKERGADGPAVFERWRASASTLREQFAATDPSTRVPWV